MQSLGQQVAAGVLGVDQVEVGDVVDQPPVGLLGHVQVEAAVAGLHVVRRVPASAWPSARRCNCWCRPRTSTASGRSVNSTSSVLIKVSPSTRPSEDVSTSRRWSGLRIPRSSTRQRQARWPVGEAASSAISNIRHVAARSRARTRPDMRPNTPAGVSLSARWRSPLSSRPIVIGVRVRDNR